MMGLRRQAGPVSGLKKGLALFAALFGVLSVVSGGTVLFGGDSVAARAGDFVAPVVWSNFLGGFLYIASGTGLFYGKRFGVHLAIFVAGLTVFVFAYFGFHIASGGAFEMRTVFAMAFRTGLWLLVVAVFWRPSGHQRAAI